MRGADHLGLGAETSGDDDAAVLGNGATDGGEALVPGGIEKAAGVHHHEVSARVLARKLVTLGAQPRYDALGIHQRLRAAEGDEADLWGDAFTHHGPDLAGLAFSRTCDCL